MRSILQNLLALLPVSDHSPMWIQLKTDFGEDFLELKASIES
jgi:hypothetical protein